MKLLITSILFLGAGVGGLGLRAHRGEGSPCEPCDPCGPADCHVEVERLDGNTCMVTCYDADGAIQCQEQVECDGPCGAAPSCGK
jgi:hypothetical protein